MSRIGKKPITIPSGVTVDIKDQTVTVKGPKGELHIALHPLVSVSQNEQDLIVDVKKKEDQGEKALWGTFGSILGNMVQGVTEGFTKQLEVNGVGYKVALQGKKLVLNVGYSHPVEFEIPEGLTAEVEKNVITLTGADKQLLGHTAAEIRKIRKPEPYKGKGIKYMDEEIRRKAGKAASKE